MNINKSQLERLKKHCELITSDLRIAQHIYERAKFTLSLINAFETQQSDLLEMAEILMDDYSEAIKGSTVEACPKCGSRYKTHHKECDYLKAEKIIKELE